MARFRVKQPVHGCAVDNPAGSDPGADGEIDKRIDPLGRAVRVLAQGRRVDVGVYADGHLQGSREPAGEAGLRPARFGGAGDVAVRGGKRVQVDRSKRADADRPQGSVTGLLAEKGDRPADRFVGCCGWEADLRPDISRVARDNTDKLGSSRLNSTVKIH